MCHPKQVCYEIIPVGDTRLSYGYTPHWNEKTNSWYCVDFLAENNATFYRFDCEEQRMYSSKVKNESIIPTFMLPMKHKDQYAVGNVKRIVVVQWDGKCEYATLVRNQTGIEEEPIYANSGLDTGSIDPKGRLVTGTYRFSGCVANQDVDGNAYLFKKSGDIRKIIENVKTIGGLAWNKHKRLMYFFDLCNYNIEEFKWDRKTGKLSKYLIDGNEIHLNFFAPK